MYFLSKIYIFCVLNRVRVSLGWPNPPTQIRVEYPPPPPPRDGVRLASVANAKNVRWITCSMTGVMAEITATI